MESLFETQTCKLGTKIGSKILTGLCKVLHNTITVLCIYHGTCSSNDMNTPLRRRTMFGKALHLNCAMRNYQMQQPFTITEGNGIFVYQYSFSSNFALNICISGKATISNDGATIMKLLDIVHPAAKTLTDIAKSQDAEVYNFSISFRISAIIYLILCTVQIVMFILGKKSKTNLQYYKVKG